MGKTEERERGRRERERECGGEGERARGEALLWGERNNHSLEN